MTAEEIRFTNFILKMIIKKMKKQVIYCNTVQAGKTI